MSSVLQILQLVVSLIGVASLCYLNYLILKALVSVLRKERSARYALAVFVAGFLLAATLQRLRVGFWDWPDVEYQVEAVNDAASPGT